jgi:hypothetical protein
MQPANPRLILHIEIDDIADDEYQIPFLEEGETYTPPPPTISYIDFFSKPGQIEPIGPLSHDFLITSSYVRFRLGECVDAAEVVNSLRPGGKLRKCLAHVDDALRHDRELVSACERVVDFLDRLRGFIS